MATFNRVYAIAGDNITVVGGPTLIFLNPKATGAGSGIEVLRVWCSQRANAVSAMQGIQIHTQVSTFPTLVSATPRVLHSDDPISGLVGATTGAAGTCGINASAEGAGAQSPLVNDNFNVLNGWLYVPTPEERIRIGVAAAATGLGVRFTNTPATLTGWSFGLIYQEV